MNVIPLISLWLVTIATSFFLSSCEADGPTNSKELIRPVRSQQVFLTGSNQIRTFSGTSKGGLEAELSFKVSGTLERIYVNVGDKLRQGQIVAKLDPRDYKLQVQRAEATLARAKATARSAAADYSRVRALYENRNASRNDLDQARAAAESSRAEVSSSSKDLDLARLQLAYTQLKSPAACSVAAVPADVNENVIARVTTVAEIICGSQFEVEVFVPEVFIARVRQGSTVGVTFDAIPERRFSAIVTKVGVASGETATTFPVTVQLQKGIPGFRSGMAAGVTFHFKSNKGRARILVPPVAVGEDREGRYVYVVEEMEGGFGIVHRKPVTVGALTAEGMEILSGLTDGERVVTAGVRRLHDGRKVRLMDSSRISS